MESASGAWNIQGLSYKEKDFCKQGNKHVDGIDESINKEMNFHNKILSFPLIGRTIKCWKPS